MTVQPQKTNLQAWDIKEKDFPNNKSMEEKIKFILGYAILAPSGHNTQPWLFEVKGRELMIRADKTRERPVVDPDKREMFISIGCAMKNLELAARYFGLQYERKIHVNFSDNDPIASYVFLEGNDNKVKTGGKILEVMVRRHTNRGSYKPTKIPLEIIEELNKLGVNYGEIGVVIFTKRDDKENLGYLVNQSIKAWYRNKDLVREMDKWLEGSNGRYDGMATELLNLPKIIKDFSPFLSQDYYEIDKRAEKDQRLVEESGAIAIVYTKRESRENWIKTGMLYEEIALEITKQGLHNAFFNGVIELKTQREKLKEQFRLPGEPQLLFRLGYGEDLRHTPRRPVEKVILSS